MKRISQTVFPYQQNPQGQFFPIVPISLSFRKKKADTSALIDSGATISIFKEDIAALLGINIEEGEEIFLGGVGGRIKGYIHKLEVEVAGKKFQMPIVFSYEYLVSLNLLGRDSFFVKFLLTFDERRRKMELR